MIVKLPQIVEAEPDSLATEWNWRQNIQEKSDRKLFLREGTSGQLN